MDANIGLFLGLFFGGFSIVAIVMFIMVYHMNKHRLKEKAAKRAHKLEAERMEIEKRHAEIDIEAKRAALLPLYCRYCGAKNEPKAKSCHSCGASMV